MILFISSKKNMNILDFLVDSEDIFVKKYIGIFNLNEFINNSINKLGHIDMLFIDLTCLNDEMEKLIQIMVWMSKKLVELYLLYIVYECFNQMLYTVDI